MKLLSRFFGRILNITSLLCALLIVFITVSVTYEISTRYFFGQAPLWVFESTEISLLYLTFLAAAWLQEQEGHVRIDLVVNRLKPRIRALVNIITSILCAIACLVVTWYSAWTTWKHYQMGLTEHTVLAIPNAVFLVIIPVGMLLLCIQFAKKSYDYVVSLESAKTQRTRGVTKV